jgi:hypothetical protein
MDTWVKVLLVGGAAYLGYELFLAPSAASAAPASWTAVGGTAAQWTALGATSQAQWNALPTSSQTAAMAQSLIAYGSSPVASVPVTVAPASATVTTSSGSLANLATAIQNAAASDPNLVNGMMTGDHWNYYANQLTGKTLPAAWPSGQITFGQYWAAQSSVVSAMTGLQGLGGLMAGLGALVNRQRRALGMGDYEPSSFTPPRLTVNPNIPNDWN